MKLTDFEYYFDEKVVERGNKLFEENRVLLDSQFNTLYNFKVKGSKIYYVTFSLRKDWVISVERCTCPYAERYLCKHMAACFYYLRKKLNIQKETMLSEFLKKNPELVEQRDNLDKVFLEK
ncbi:MAG: hypothetical protein LUG16_02830 [Candidatus Gastranaerophilales bacterium]|nr:hypothetical protein [Candidatus Gastranaerophilales bacterium]